MHGSESKTQFSQNLSIQYITKVKTMEIKTVFRNLVKKSLHA